MIKFSVSFKYQITKSSYLTTHEFTKTVVAENAIEAVVGVLNQIEWDAALAGVAVVNVSELTCLIVHGEVLETE